jgi:hypothetical protein
MVEIIEDKTKARAPNKEMAAFLNHSCEHLSYSLAADIDGN